MLLEDGALIPAMEVSSLDEMVGPSAFFSSGRMHSPPAADRFTELTALGAERPEALSRVFDIVFSVIVLIAVAPVLLVLIIIFQIDNPGSVFFVQERIGKNGARFPCLKLRTMVADAPERLTALLRDSPEARAEWDAHHKLRNDPRVTALGRFARNHSLDELPQLVNILLGHMSVVGPRPIVEAEIWRYGPLFADYCSVRPGLTGLWQVSGRNDVSYDQRVRLDRDYARSKSFLLDLKIIARTFGVVVAARGAY